MLVRSILPNFNLDVILNEKQADLSSFFLCFWQNYLVPAGAAGAEGGENDVGMLQALQESIRDLFRDMALTNINDEQIEQAQNNDDDENNHEFD